MESKDIKPNKGYISAIFFLIGLILFLTYNIWNSRQEIGDLEDRETRLVEERDILRERIEQLKEEINRTDPAEPGVEKEPRSLLSNFDISRLKRMGLEDPVNDITQDLLRRSDLIQHEGVLGGTMGFYSPDNIHILSPQWVFAYFEDGHIRGEMLLEYSIERDGTISWKVIESYLE